MSKIEPEFDSDKIIEQQCPYCKEMISGTPQQVTQHIVTCGDETAIMEGWDEKEDNDEF